MLLQIQSVIYGNEINSLLKAMKALKQAVRVYNQKKDQLRVELIYGDSSPQPIIKAEMVSEIKKTLNPEIKFRYQYFGFNAGTAKGHNLMAQNTEADYIMIMNPDVIVEPNCICKLLDELQCDEVGMAEARQTPLEHAKEYNKENGETEWASTACTIFKKSVYEEVGGFDENTFFLYCDDLDFSWMIRLAGYKIIYVPSAIAYHAKKLSIDGGWKPTSAEVYYSAEAAMLLAYKWSNEKRAEKLCKTYLTVGGEFEKKAANEYLKRKQENKLPKQVDETHKIAVFLEDDYCEMRFKY